jgi:hypothetical protein
MLNFDPNIGFWEKRHFFRRKLSKIAENCDHNIDPWSGGFVYNNFFATKGQPNENDDSDKNIGFSKSTK